MYTMARQIKRIKWPMNIPEKLCKNGLTPVAVNITAENRPRIIVFRFASLVPE